ncbi:MAG: hypothetical protein J5775_02575 [Spirochaetales bacterium]|nr:hypothetical protein [Spirochaetales bacterium]
MKRLKAFPVVVLLLFLVLSSAVASVSFSVGPRAEYRPFDHDFTNSENLKDADSFVYGLEAGLFWKDLVGLELDVGIQDKVMTTTYLCFRFKVAGPVALKAGAGINLEFSKRQDDGKVVVTSGGLLLKRLKYVSEYPSELMLRTFMFKAAVEVEIAGFLALQADYLVVPHYLHSVVAEDKGLPGIFFSGILGVSLKYVI